MLKPRLPLTVLIVSVSWLVLLSAKVLQVEITSRADVLNGQSFGSAGAYEHLAGKVYFSVAVASPHNRRIVDLANAVNLKNGEVEFPPISARFVLRMLPKGTDP